MLLAIKDQDLIPREFKMHPQCYKEYTRVCSKQSTTANLPDGSNDNEDETSTSQKTATDFESVSAFVEQHVINGSQSVSLKVLTDMYGFDREDSRLRAKIKKRLEQAFAEKIVFVRVAYHESEIVVSKGALTATMLTTFIKESKSFVLKEAASSIRSEILEMMSSAQDLPWPPTPEGLSLKSRQPPESVTDFVTNIIHAFHHSPGEDVKRYASSISSDLVHAVSMGKFLTEKHVILGTGLHSLTGQKIPIKILGKFGHSINYDSVRMVETAQAEIVQQLRSLHNPLPLLPATELDRVITFFWWDNFDCKKENTVGSLHTTHGVAYQEESTTALEQSISFQVEKSSRRSVAVTPLDLDKRKVIQHRNPCLFEASETMEIEEMVKSEERVRRIVIVLKDDFLDPFSDAIDQSRLFSLASGRPLQLEISNEILTTESRGKVMFSEFSNRLDASAEEQLEFFDPIKKAPWHGFNKIDKKVSVSAKGKTKDVAVQRDILGVLMAESYIDRY